MRIVQEVSLTVGQTPKDTTLTIEGEDCLAQGGVRYIKLEVQPNDFPRLELGIWSERFKLNGPVGLRLVHLTDPSLGHHLTRREIGEAFDRAVALTAGKEMSYHLWDHFANRTNHAFFEEFFYQCLLRMGLPINRTEG